MCCPRLQPWFKRGGGSPIALSRCSRGRPLAQDFVNAELLGRRHQLGGEDGDFDVGVLALLGEPVEGLARADVEVTHDDAFGLFDNAPGGVGVDKGLRGGTPALDGDRAGQVGGQTMNGRNFPGFVPFRLSDGQDAVFVALAIQDPVKVRTLATLTGEGLNELAGRIPVPRVACGRERALQWARPHPWYIRG